MKKRYIIAVRILVLALFYRRATYTYGGFQKALLFFVEWIVHHPLSLLLFCSLYLIRPFILLPVGRLSVLAGVFWGRWPGILIALGGELVSACIAFKTGKHLSRDALDSKNEEAFGKFAFILMRYPLFAVILSRISPLPDDVINYGRGILRISRTTYLRGTILGNAPFSILNVAMGVQIDPEILLTEGIQAGISWSTLIVLGIVYGILLIAATITYRRMHSKD